MKTGRKKPKSAWKKGQSGNPAGRPKDGESWAAIVKAVGDMYSDDILAFIGRDNDLGRMLSELPSNVQMKYLVTARVFSSLMFEPSSGLWKELMERTEGKVPQTLQGPGEKGEHVVSVRFIDDTGNDNPAPEDAPDASGGE